MSKYVSMIITVITCITLSILGFVLGGFKLSQNQLDTFIILGIVCASSATYCFVVGQISGNNSQMDKLWSIVPVAYVWIIAAKGGMSPRLIVYAIITTLWGIRLTYNFARKGAYSIKFWEGREDYRWEILRKNKIFQSPAVWMAFNLLFISIYQNVLILAMVLPALAIMDSAAPFGAWDIVAAVLASSFLLLETIADEQQWKFHQNKKKLLEEKGSLSDLPEPYSKGFNTTGVWGYMRHPNYLGEQSIWICLYIFAIGAGVTTYGIFNWSMFGPLFIVLLFLGSSTLGESISNGKYSEYKYYLAYIPKYIPLRKYDYEKAKEKLS